MVQGKTLRKPTQSLSAEPATSVATTGSPVKSAARTLDVLEELAVGGPRSLHALAGTLDLPKSSLHALLRTMAARGWLETDASGTIYSLGIRALLIASAFLDADLVIARTSSLLDELAQATGESVHLARLEGNEVVYLAKRESIHPLRMFSAVGRRLPAYATALGRALLAERSDSEIAAMLPASIVPITPHTTRSRKRLLETIHFARREGYAMEEQESCVGVSCFAVSLPLSTPAKEAISISVPLSRLDPSRRDQIVELLIRARSRAQQAHP